MPKKTARIGSRLGNRVTIKKLVNKKTGERTHKVYLWRASFMVGDVRKQKGFKTKAAAERFKEEREVETMAFGNAAQLTTIERSAVLESREPLDDAGITLRDAINYALDHHRKSSDSAPVKQVVEELIAAKERAKKSGAYVQTLESRLNRFKKSFGERAVATITAKEVTAWIDGLSVGDRSKNHFRREVGTMLGFAVKRGYAEENVITGVETIKVVSVDDVGILTPKQAAKLVDVADARILPAIALGLFAGVRDAELKRLDWGAVTLRRAAMSPHGSIRIESKVSKTARDRRIPISANLHAILKPLMKTEGAIWVERGRELSEEARLKAGFAAPKKLETLRIKSKKEGKVFTLKVWLNNALRHSFASYHIAKHENADALALLMGHENTSLIFKHYREIVTPEDAAAYFTIGLSNDSETEGEAGE